MQRYFSYLNSAVSILQEYKGAQPFVHFLRNFFREHKKFGSRDRKEVTQLCYVYFRIGHALKELSIQDRILVGLLLCSNTENELLKALKPDWNEKVAVPLEEKFVLVNLPDATQQIFPWQNDLSEGINPSPFAISHLQQPDLFVRIRPGFEKIVIDKLHLTGINYDAVNENCLAFSNSTKLDELLEINKEVVIQDFSSQRIADFFPLKDLSPSALNHVPSVWDCCAGSGGKSILAHDHLGALELTVSDIRENILVNLKKRFSEAGIANFKSFTADLTAAKNTAPVRRSGYDMVIADVPCSGSGTWSRTPEYLSFFDFKKIKAFNALQKKIVDAIIPQIKQNGFLLYITCSVFKNENESIVEYIEEKHGFTRVKMGVIKGYEKKADTMFAALLVSTVRRN